MKCLSVSENIHDPDKIDIQYEHNGFEFCRIYPRKMSLFDIRDLINSSLRDYEQRMNIR